MRKLFIISILILFCSAPVFAQEVDSLILQANSLVDQQYADEAALIFEKILNKDSANYESLAFLGNYHFLLGEMSIKKANADYQAIIQPNRMQTANYQSTLRKIYYADYVKANLYIQQALRINKNDHLEKLVAKIQAFKIKIGLTPVVGKKK